MRVNQRCRAAGRRARRIRTTAAPERAHDASTRRGQTATASRGQWTMPSCQEPPCRSSRSGGVPARFGSPCLQRGDDVGTAAACADNSDKISPGIGPFRVVVTFRPRPDTHATCRRTSLRSENPHRKSRCGFGLERSAPDRIRTCDLMLRRALPCADLGQVGPQVRHVRRFLQRGEGALPLAQQHQHDRRGV
jgi:hypothetical protein